MADVNQHINILHIGGKACSKPELRRTKGDKNNVDGVPVCSFRIAHNSARKIKDHSDDKTTFMNCEIWGSRAEAASESIGIGDIVEVLGPIQIKQYVKDGIKQYYTKMLVRMIIHNKKVTSDPVTQDARDLDDKPIEQDVYVSDADPSDEDSDDISFE